MALSPSPSSPPMSPSEPWGRGRGVSSAVTTDKGRSGDGAARCFTSASTALLFLCLTRAVSWAVSASHLRLSREGLQGWEWDRDGIAVAEGEAACRGDQRLGAKDRDRQRQPLLLGGQAETWQHSSLP